MAMTCSCIGIPACSCQVCQGTGGAGSWGASGTLGSSALSCGIQLCVVVSPDNHRPSFPLPGSGSPRSFGDLDRPWTFYLTSFCEVGGTLPGYSLLRWARYELPPFSCLQGKEKLGLYLPIPRDPNPSLPRLGEALPC